MNFFIYLYIKEARNKILYPNCILLYSQIQVFSISPQILAVFFFRYRACYISIYSSNKLACMDDSLLYIHQLITHSKPKRKWGMAYLAICCLKVLAPSLSSSSKEEINTPLVDNELTISRNRSKWRTVYQAIYCARAVISLSL